MTYSEAQPIIEKYLYKKFKSHIMNGLFLNPVVISEEKKVLLGQLPGLQMEGLQQYLNEMYDAGMIVKDDGITVQFSPSYIKSLKAPRYFEN